MRRERRLFLLGERLECARPFRDVARSLGFAHDGNLPLGGGEVNGKVSERFLNFPLAFPDPDRYIMDVGGDQAPTNHKHRGHT